MGQKETLLETLEEQGGVQTHVIGAQTPLLWGLGWEGRESLLEGATSQLTPEGQ